MAFSIRTAALLRRKVQKYLPRRVDLSASFQLLSTGTRGGATLRSNLSSIHSMVVPSKLSMNLPMQGTSVIIPAFVRRKTPVRYCIASLIFQLEHHFLPGRKRQIDLRQAHLIIGSPVASGRSALSSGFQVKLVALVKQAGE